MKRIPLIVIAFLLLNCSANDDVIHVKITGLKEPVEIIRDSLGINHIYAKNEHDLFFVQGYAAAKDRLFQFEIWRRRASGTVAEILGERELQRDIGARLFHFRGDIQEEMQHYHPNGKEIITAFVAGVNAYIDEANTQPENLPIEFKLLGIKPRHWTPEIVVSRHQGLVGNATDELNYARAVYLLGEDHVKTVLNFEPGVPDLKFDKEIDPKWLMQEGILDLYEAFRKPIAFQKEDLSMYSESFQEKYLAIHHLNNWDFLKTLEKGSVGSNNWVISGSKTESGYPIMANDPHRALAVPSLRYMVHLSAPGWDVIGGGEPVIPGVSIGHNGIGAWGLTVFETDNEDIYVYKINPHNQEQYWYKGEWVDMLLIQDTIKVKNADDVMVTHRYTHHGPVTKIDKENNIAFALRCAWLEKGSAPYLASLRMNQASNWDEFREACTYSFIPGENMVWADSNGNIGWQAVGIAPVRTNWNGLLPVPGDGRYEWSGYLPVKDLPHQYNPSSGFIVTANENLIPDQYPHRNAVGWEWADAFRGDRIREVLAQEKKFTLEDMVALQHDYLSIPARQLVPLLKSLPLSDPDLNQAYNYLLDWDFVLDNASPAAAIYVMWERKLRETLREKLVPENARAYIPHIAVSKTIELLTNAHLILGKNPKSERDSILISALKKAIVELKEKLGADMSSWNYADNNYHRAWMRHPLSSVLSDDTRQQLDIGPIPRRGYGSTPGATGNADIQTHGASFRAIIDTKDFDLGMFNNAPGQSGNPESKFYRNLLSSWSNDQLFYTPYQKKSIMQAAEEKFMLLPGK